MKDKKDSLVLCMRGRNKGEEDKREKKNKNQSSMVCVVIAQELRSEGHSWKVSQRASGHCPGNALSQVPASWRVGPLLQLWMLDCRSIQQPRGRYTSHLLSEDYCIPLLSFPVLTWPLRALPSSPAVALPSAVPQLPTQDRTLDLSSSVINTHLTLSFKHHSFALVHP